MSKAVSTATKSAIKQSPEPLPAANVRDLRKRHLRRCLGLSSELAATVAELAFREARNSEVHA